VTGYIIRRLGWTAVVLTAMSMIVFSLVRLMPGDPAIILLGQRADAKLAAQIREALGLTEPIVTQYLSWLRGVAHGDFGLSMAVFGQSGPSGVPVWDVIKSSLAITLPLTVLGMVFAGVIGCVTGMLGAFWHGSPKDYGLSVLTFVGVSIPEFYLGILFILLFSIKLGWFPATGSIAFSTDPVGALHHLLLPAITLGLINAAAISRMLRASMLEVLHLDYITASRAKGAPASVVYFKHAMRNALLPTLTVAGLQAGYLLGGAIVIERVFALPGMGWNLLEAVSKRDYPMIQGLVLTFALMFALINLLTDILYGIVDPKVRSAVTRGTAGARISGRRA
jgi:peptide/nickel transport system permease protein